MQPATHVRTTRPPARSACPILLLLAFLAAGAGSRASAQTCTTQSQMTQAGRDTLAGVALKLAQAIQAGDQTAVKTLTIPEFVSNFTPVADVIASSEPRLKSGHPQVEQLYLLDASSLKSATDTQFFCTLNHSQAEADFSIPQLPPGRYAFAMVRFDQPSPFRLSFLLRQSPSTWLLAGLYPKPLAAAGHEGLWYWTQARQLAATQPWTAWLYLQEAQILLQPAAFVSSTHLEKLSSELSTSAPPAAKGLSSDAPLVLKASDGQEYRFAALSVDDSLGKEKIDVAAHLKIDSLGDGGAARQRNLAAMAALVAAHPRTPRLLPRRLDFRRSPRPGSLCHRKRHDRDSLRPRCNRTVSIKPRPRAANMVLW